MPTLAKVTGDLDAPRGPDVSLAVSVPASWLGRKVEIALPRNLKCAMCDGGGCDRCGRAGAVSLRERSDEEERLLVGLPLHEEQAGGEQGARALVLRIPERGGHGPEGLPRGHLLLRIDVVPGAEGARVEGSPMSGPLVQLVADDTVSAPHADRRELMVWSVVLAVVLVLLFIGMLYLSGWL